MSTKLMKQHRILLRLVTHLLEAEIEIRLERLCHFLQMSISWLLELTKEAMVDQGM